MKIKYNIPMINSIKEKINNITNKIKNNNKIKISKRNYALLFLMILLGIATLSKNINEYNKSNTEEYAEYELEESKPIDSNKVENIIYETAQSSIFTTEASEEVVATFSTTGTSGINLQLKEFANPGHEGHYGHGHDSHGNNQNAGGGISWAE